MVGPSIMLAGLALGSGEFILWPYITYKTGFIFFWACMLGVITQFFVNMEIERWTLVTGESAVTGFCRLSRHWAWIMLVLNVVPWAWPGWATGAGTLLSWILFPPGEGAAEQGYAAAAQYVPHFAIAGLLLVGIILTLGPVVYKTVERIQIVLVGSIFLLVVLLSILVIPARCGPCHAEGLRQYWRDALSRTDPGTGDHHSAWGTCFRWGRRND